MTKEDLNYSELSNLHAEIQQHILEALRANEIGAEDTQPSLAATLARLVINRASPLELARTIPEGTSWEQLGPLLDAIQHANRCIVAAGHI